MHHNIGMILNAPYPSDMRVKKETDALLKAGFQIFLLCLRRDGEKYEEVVDGIRVTRLDGGKNNFQLAWRDVIMSINFKHPEFMKAIPGWVSKYNLRLLHVHDLPLAGTAIACRNKGLSLKVVVDLHENYPEALKTWFQWKKNLIARFKNLLFMNASRWTRHEKFAVAHADHVIAVVDEMKRRLIHDYNVAAEKITVVTNSEGQDFLQQKKFEDIYSDFTNKFIITYSGNIGPHRGVDTAIEAMQYLKDENGIVLVIVGSGSSPIMNHLKQLASTIGVTGKVHFLGRQPFEKFYSYMKFTDVNIIPHKSNGHTDNTVPHKLFQAMMVGNPVLVSSSDPLKRIVSTTQSGLIFQAGDAKDLAQKILMLYNDEALRRNLSSNGVSATINGNMNWEHDQRFLLEVYQSLLV